MRGFQELSIVVHSLLHFTYVFLVRLTHHPPVCTLYDIIIARCQGSNTWVRTAQGSGVLWRTDRSLARKPRTRRLKPCFQVQVDRCGAPFPPCSVVLDFGIPLLEMHDKWSVWTCNSVIATNLKHPQGSLTPLHSAVLQLTAIWSVLAVV